MDIKYLITIDSAGAVKSIEGFDKAVAGVGKTAEASRPKIGNLVAAIGAGIAVYEGVRRSLSGVIDFMKNTVTAAMESEQAEKNLRLALETTGREVLANAAHFNKYAEELMGVTRYDDEAIKSTQALLLQLTNLDQKGIDEATKGAIGLASVMGGGPGALESAARILAKALEGNIERLGMYIPKVKAAKTEAEKLKIMKEELAKMFSRAKGEVDTFSGRIDSLKKYYNELQENIGKAVVQSKGFNAILGMLTDTMKAFIDPASKGSLTIGLFGTFVEAAAQKIMSKFGPALLLLRLDMAKAKYNAEHAGLATRTFVAAWELLGKISPGVQGALSGWANEIKKLWDAQNKGGKDAAKEIKKVVETFRPLNEKSREFSNILKGWTVWMKGESIPAMRQLGDVAGQAISIAAADFQRLKYAAKNSITEIAESWQGKMEGIRVYTDKVISEMQNIFMLAQRNKEIALENEYKKRLDWINANVKDEGERQKAVEALEAEYQIKRTSAMRTAAKQQKMIAITEAIINTADAVTKALAQGGFLLGIPWAAIVAGLGAVQIALIARQPLPLDVGGLIKKKTRFYSEGGQAYDIAERRPEVIAPVEELPRLARQLTRGGREGEMIFNLTIPIYVAGQKVETQIIKIVRRAFNLNQIPISVRATAR